MGQPMVDRGVESGALPALLGGGGHSGRQLGSQALAERLAASRRLPRAWQRCDLGRQRQRLLRASLGSQSIDDAGQGAGEDVHVAEAAPAVHQSRMQVRRGLLQLAQPDGDGSPLWRAALEDTLSGERYGFATAEALAAFLQRLVEEEGVEGMEGKKGI